MAISNSWNPRSSSLEYACTRLTRRVPKRIGVAALGWGVAALGWGVAALGWEVAALGWGVAALGWGVAALGWGVAVLGWGVAFEAIAGGFGAGASSCDSSFAGDSFGSCFRTKIGLTIG
jgi:hypothetical protein